MARRIRRNSSVLKRAKPAVNFAVAARYLHSHNSMIERGDLDRAVDLLVKILPRLDAKTVSEISRF